MADKVDPFDVEALETSLNDSATCVSALWISFLIFGLYLVIAAGTVMHRQLLLEDPIKLPVLNIELPLVGFFFLAPILFVIFHAYVLLQVLLLGRTAAAYNEAVEHNIKVAADNARVRQRLANTLFAQIFAGSPRERDGLLGWSLRTVARITLAIAPVLILLFFQFQFLPYHSGWVTWAIRILIVVDLAIILVLWPAARDPGHDVTLRQFVQQRVALPIAIATAALSWAVLSFPGEPHAEWTRYWPDEKSRLEAAYFGDDLQCRTRSPISWAFASFDRLSLPRVDVVDDEKLEKIKERTKAAGTPNFQGERTRLLRNRDFNCANFSDFADLRRVDFGHSLFHNASFSRSELQGTSFEKAQLQGALFEAAHLQGVTLTGANLRGAYLKDAELQLASFDGAELNGTSLYRAKLQGTSFFDAQLKGADLGGAQLQGAFLNKAKLHGASLNGAQLQGASLRYTELQGAFLSGANLQGTRLSNAQLQGTDLNLSVLKYAILDHAFVWRAKNAVCDLAWTANIYDNPIIQIKDSANFNSFYLTKQYLLRQRRLKNSLKKQ
jgi:uncharacterized protein YjbI with pentapeptide repeats